MNDKPLIECLESHFARGSPFRADGSLFLAASATWAALKAVGKEDSLSFHSTLRVFLPSDKYDVLRLHATSLWSGI
jgi:hypothetical protein